MSALPPPPLEGLRVLDHGHVWAGPLLGRSLSEAGAEVIKVEAPDRASGIVMGGAPDRGESDEHDPRRYHDYDRGKLGITLDLAGEPGKALYRSLIAISDIVIENFSANVMNSLGIGYDVLSEVKEYTTAPERLEDARGVSERVQIEAVDLAAARTSQLDHVDRGLRDLLSGERCGARQWLDDTGLGATAEAKIRQIQPLRELQELPNRNRRCRPLGYVHILRLGGLDVVPSDLDELDSQIVSSKAASDIGAQQRRPERNNVGIAHTNEVVK